MMGKLKPDTPIFEGKNNVFGVDVPDNTNPLNKSTEVSKVSMEKV